MEEFNVSEFINYYISKSLLVILFLVLGVACSIFYTDELQVPLYKSQTSLVLTRSNDTSTITNTDISLNKNLVSTYREIIKSRRILSKVIKHLNLNITEKELSKQISVTSANDTELIMISVVDEDSKKARDIANEIASVFKKEITSIYNIENISIVDEAVRAIEPYNVSAIKQYVIGATVGFLLGSLIITIIFYFDDTIKKPEDIEEKLGLSILSTVPKYKNKRKK